MHITILFSWQKSYCDQEAMKNKKFKKRWKTLAKAKNAKKTEEHSTFLFFFFKASCSIRVPYATIWHFLTLLVCPYENYKKEKKVFQLGKQWRINQKLFDSVVRYLRDSHESSNLFSMFRSCSFVNVLEHWQTNNCKTWNEWFVLRPRHSLNFKFRESLGLKKNHSFVGL